MEQSSFRAKLRGLTKLTKLHATHQVLGVDFFSLLLSYDHGQGYFTQTKTFSIVNFFNVKFDQNVKFTKTALKVRPPNIFKKFNFPRPFSIKIKLNLFFWNEVLL